jgi:acetyl esterase
VRNSKQIPDSVRNAFKGTPWEAMLISRLRELSPVNRVNKDAPPFLLIHGTVDTLVPYEQSVEMCRKLRETGDTCDLYTVHGGGHGIQWWDAVHLTAYKHYMMRWLEAQLQPAPGIHSHT